ncbi:MAG: glucokinase [Gammaproteobacteria bacterium]|nr:glucokinase [Gammaproteobacteria bacterium]MBU1722286.1 glucokinase [Gammaproteobacteria bacterium]MBU2005393.1 glucokinase [Gammaproteobacteria bacterium]
MEIIAGDIGGTKSWLAWAQMAGSKVEVRFEHVYASADFPSAEALMQQFLNDASQPGKPDAVCLALPGSVQSGQPIRLTNLDWVLEHASLQGLLETPRLLFINDFQAAAEGVVTLTPDDYVVLNEGVTPHPNPSPSRGEGLRDSFLAPPLPLRERGPGGEGAIRVITGAGTGLGLAWMQADHAGRYHTFPTEGGHTDFSPANAQQERLLAFMRQRFSHVSWERVLSGPGVNQVYQFCLLDMTGEIPVELRERNGAVVNSAAQAGDPVALAAMQLFTDLYANWVGNLALLYQPRGGLYLGGGISARIQPWLQTQGFLDACFDKGRMSELVRQMPIYLITNTRLGLQGALEAALHHTKD